MLSTGLNIWHTSIAHGGAIAPDFPPNVSGTQATIAADFAGNQYWAAGAAKGSFAAWLTALGGTYTRSSSATYLQGGVVKTAAANTPRFPTNLGGVTQGIRLTGAATNAITNSQIFSGANWGTVGQSSLANNVATAPDGTNTATSVTEAGTATSSCAFYFIGASGGNTATLQCFVKAGARSWIQVFAVAGGISVGANFNLFGAGSVGFTSGAITPKITALANGWYLCSISSASTDINNSQIYFIDSNVNALQPQYSMVAGTIAGYVWGMQLTGTGFPCDYIPTTTVAVTQAADVLNFPYTQTTFSALMQTNGLPPSLQQQQLPLWAEGSNDLMLINPGATNFLMYNGTVQITGPTFSGNMSAPHKTMVAGNASTSSMTTDGLAPVSGTYNLTPSANSHVYVGSNNIAGLPMYGNVGQLALWNGLVASAAEMQRLTAGVVQPPSTFDPAGHGTAITLTNGNQNVTTYPSPLGNAQPVARGAKGYSTGKHYVEFLVVACNGNTNSNGEIFFGLGDATTPGGAVMDNGLSGIPNSYMTRDDGYHLSSGISPSVSAGLGTFGSGAVIGVAVDVDAKKMWFSTNNVWRGSGDPASGANPYATWTGAFTIYPFCLVYAGGSNQIKLNTDSLIYAPPAGFTAWG